MTRNTYVFISLLVLIATMGACSSTPFDELPTPISSMISEYFPFGEIESYTIDDESGNSTVQIKKGARLSFDSDYRWIDVDGRGQTLPQQFLYDQLSPTLYDYIESIEHQTKVYRVRRTAATVLVNFSDSDLEYDIVTQTITYPAAHY